MAIIDKQKGLISSLCLAFALASVPAAYAQSETIRVEQRVDAMPFPSAAGQIVMRPGVVISATPAIARSNFEARLGHLLEQINLATDRGWLSPDQSAYLRQWQANLVQTEANLRAADGGLLSRSNSDQMERFVNSLALSVNMAINH